jgi:hypothetical protein
MAQRTKKMPKVRENYPATVVVEFDEYFKKHEGLIDDSLIIEEFLSKYSEGERDNLRPLLKESVFFRNTLSFRPMPKEMSERVWERIKKKFDESKLKKEEGKVIALNKRPDLLLLLLYARCRKKVAVGIRGVTRIMKYLFLMMKEKDLGKYVEDNYSFAHHNLGPFDKRLYDDLDILRRYDLIEKVPVLKTRESLEERNIAEFFELDDSNTEYMLTEKGLKFAKALELGANNVDKNIMKSIEEIKSKYSQYQLLQLLEYIYDKYPEYRDKSIIWQKIKKMRESER